jgi:hypothetical protein
MRLHRHHWEPHPEFAALNDCSDIELPIVRRCTTCRLVEERVFPSMRRDPRSFDRAADHLQPRRVGLAGRMWSWLVPLESFGFYLEVSR